MEGTNDTHQRNLERLDKQRQDISSIQKMATDTELVATNVYVQMKDQKGRLEYISNDVYETQHRALRSGAVVRRMTRRDFIKKLILWSIAILFGILDILLLALKLILIYHVDDSRRHYRGYKHY